jgi:transposase
MSATKDKREYRAADGLLLRSEGRSADDVARRLGVTRKQVFTWTRKFRASGTDGLRMKKQTGRPRTKADAAKPKIEAIIDKDPQVFGYLKGRWVLRDISKELKKEGITMHWTSVRRMLDDMGIGLKSPKLRALGSIKKNYRKRAEIRRYKRIAPALLKKKFLSDFKTRNGQISSRKSSDAGLEKGKHVTSQRLVTPSA